MAADILTRSDLTRPDDATGVDLQWLEQPVQPLDLNGPVSRPYRRIERSDIERPLFSLFSAVADLHSDRIATDDGVRQLTYGDLHAASLCLASALAAVAPARKPIGVLLPNDAWYPLAVLACLAAGNPCVLLDCNYPAARNAAIIADAGIAAIIVSADGELSAATQVASVPIDTAFADTALPPVQPAADGAPDEPAFILYTSGSTGRPKGIALAQRTVVHRAGQVIDALHINADDRIMPLGSPCTVAGLLQMFEALLAGATLIKIDLQRVGIGAALEAIEDKAATVLLATPALLRRLCQIEGARRRLRGLRCLYTSGDVLLSVDVAALRRHLDCPLLVTYGATEAPGIAHWFATQDDASGAARVSSGYPLPDYRYAILDETDGPVGSGEVGELVVSSRFTALGDWQGGRLVPGRLAPNPRAPQERVFRTGDLVRRRSDGLITVLGRKDRLVKIRGMRVEPYELECALRGAPAVADAAVLVRHDDGDAQLVAFVVPAGGTRHGVVDTLRADLRRVLPTFMQPVRLHEIECLPLLPGHKIDTAALAAFDDARLAENAAPSEAPVSEPADAAASHVAAAWAQLLDEASFTADLPFDAAGGDSLALLMLVSDLEKRCGVELPLLQFAPAMRPSEMVGVLNAILADHAGAAPATPAAAASVQSPSLVLLKPGTRPLPIFLMHGLGGHATELTELVRNLHCDHPIYGLQLPGLAPGEPALDCIPDMTARFVAPIRAAAPRGPFLLVGYSMGGLVAFDLACRLQAFGEATRLLMLDTYPSPRFWPIGAWLDWLGRRLRLHYREALRESGERLPAHFLKMASSLVDHLCARGGLGPIAHTPTWLPEAPELRRVRTGMAAAKTRYRPAHYPHIASFVQPETLQSGAPTEPMAAWRGKVAGLRVMRTQGDHLSMALRYADVTARLIDRWVVEQSA